MSSTYQHSPFFEQTVRLIREQQRLIVSQLEEIDGKQFLVDEWTRDGGGGTTCVLQEGNVFESGGVNISIVEGAMKGAAVSQMRADHASIVTTSGDNIPEALPYSAAGISLILHPLNPMAPTAHMNCRFLETFNSDGSLKSCWYGGGADLTPYFLFEEDAQWFHHGLKEVCDRHHERYYPKFKGWCDKYFWNAHRGEARGIGGIFFNDLDGNDLAMDLQLVFRFVQDFLKSFTSIYTPDCLETQRTPIQPS